MDQEQIKSRILAADTARIVRDLSQAWIGHRESLNL